MVEEINKKEAKTKKIKKELNNIKKIYKKVPKEKLLMLHKLS